MKFGIRKARGTTNFEIPNAWLLAGASARATDTCHFDTSIQTAAFWLSVSLFCFLIIVLRATLPWRFYSDKLSLSTYFYVRCKFLFQAWIIEMFGCTDKIEWRQFYWWLMYCVSISKFRTKAIYAIYLFIIWFIGCKNAAQLFCRFSKGES